MPRTDKGIWVSFGPLLGPASQGIWVYGYLGIDRRYAGAGRARTHGDLIGRRRLRRDRFTGSGGLGVRRRADADDLGAKCGRRLLHHEHAR